MSFVEQLPAHVEYLKGERGRINDQLRQMRMDALGGLEDHATCCEECPRRVEFDEEFDRRESELLEDEDYVELEADLKAINEELERVQRYRKVVGV